MNFTDAIFSFNYYCIFNGLLNNPHLAAFGTLSSTLASISWIRLADNGMGTW